MDDTKDVHRLALVLVQPLDLDVEHRLGVDLVAERRLDVVREALLVALLDRGPLLAEGGVLREREELLQHEEVLEPDLLRNAERLGDERAELGVALVEPPTRSN